MRVLILKLLAFIALQIGLLYADTQFFQSDMPLLGGLAGGLHIVVLAAFPYVRFFARSVPKEVAGHRSAGYFVPALLLGCMLLLSSCSQNRVLPNKEGVLMSNYGRAGKNDFTAVTGAQGPLWLGSELYQVPMWEQTRVDVDAIKLKSINGGMFDVDPTYSYQPLRGKGVDIIFAYQHVGLDDDEKMMDNIQKVILSPLILDVYRDEARKYSTDYLINHSAQFEAAVDTLLRERFAGKFFQLTNLTSNLTPPKSMDDAIEKTNNAVQEVAQIKNQLAVSEMEQQKAEIEAQTNIIRSKGLTPQILQERYIEALRTSNNKVIITDGKSPVMITK